jgi:membrane-associated protein
MIHDLLNFLDPMIIIKTLGLIGIFIIIFAESGLFFCFFLPGDSLLFTAGFLASQNYLDISILAVGCFFSAILGDNIGYWFGKKVGPKIFCKEDSIFFHKKHILRAQNFYEKYGNKTIFLARFVAIVRTFAPIVAGIGNMKYRNFMTYNIISGLIWTSGLIFSGYFLEQIIPGVDKYILHIILIIIFVSVLPVVFEISRSKKEDSQDCIK